MKNVFVIFVLAIFMLQSCKDKAPTVDFNNATFLSEQDILKAIRLNEDFLDGSKFQKKDSNSLPIGSGEKTSLPDTNSQKANDKILSYSQSNGGGICEIFPNDPNCSGFSRGKINNDCLPKGPCFGVSGLDWLIIYYRTPEFRRKWQINLVKLKTGVTLESMNSDEGKFKLSSFNVKSMFEVNELLGLQYFNGKERRNIAINITK